MLYVGKSFVSRLFQDENSITLTAMVFVITELGQANTMNSNEKLVGWKTVIVFSFSLAIQQNSSFQS